MSFLWALMFALILAVSIYWWPREKRDLKTILATAGILGSVIGGITYATQAWPVDHIKIEKIQKEYVDPPKVVYKDRIVYRAPDEEVAPVDVKAACAGSIPLQLVKIDEQTPAATDDDKKPDSTTWILAHPVESKVLITCGQPGAYASFWKVGDVIQIVRGIPQ